MYLFLLCLARRKHARLLRLYMHRGAHSLLQLLFSLFLPPGDTDLEEHKATQCQPYAGRGGSVGGGAMLSLINPFATAPSFLGTNDLEV